GRVRAVPGLPRRLVLPGEPHDAAGHRLDSPGGIRVHDAAPGDCGNLAIDWPPVRLRHVRCAGDGDGLLWWQPAADLFRADVLLGRPGPTIGGAKPGSRPSGLARPVLLRGGSRLPVAAAQSLVPTRDRPDTRAVTEGPSPGRRVQRTVWV